MKSKACLLAVLALVFVLGFWGQAQDRDVKVSEAPQIPNPYTDTWLVVIGINNYQRVPKLQYAVSDAEAIKELMIKAYGVKPDHITTLYNEKATRSNLAYVMGDALADPTRVKPTDRVIIYFAGHGTQTTPERGEPMGYLIPVDGDPKNLASTCVSMREIQESAKRIPARHILYLVDACYGGIAGIAPPSQTLDAKALLDQASKDQAIQIITAGAANQQVYESPELAHSIFTHYLLLGLSGKADLNQDGIITSLELFVFVSQGVSADTQRQQTPQMFTLYGTGQVIFISPAGLPAAQTKPISTRAKLIVETNPPGADIYINGDRVGKSPQSGIDLDPGKYQIEIKLKGYRTEHRVIELGPGQVESISLTLVKAPKDYRKYLYTSLGVLGVTAAVILATQPSSSEESSKKKTGTIVINGAAP